jgi:hypothetical protein
MAKPAITKRSVKAAALTYNELDTNFQNLADATVSITAGSGGTQVTSDLNGNITLVAGSGVTLTGNNTAKTITINSTGGSSQNTFSNVAVSGQSTIAADTTTDTLTIAAGTNIQLTTNATTDTLTITSTGVSNPMTADLNLNGFVIRSGGFTNIQVDDDINFPSGTGPFAPGSSAVLLCRGNSINLQTANLVISSTTLQTPSNTTTPAAWLRVTVNGSVYSVPLYQ